MKKTLSNWNRIPQILLLTGAFTAASVLSGCGSEPESPATSSTIGQSSGTSPSAPVEDITTRCSREGGSLVSSSTGQLCKVVKSFNSATFGSISYGYSRYGFSLPLTVAGENTYYRVANGNPFVLTGLSVEANDQVSYSIIGNYGTTTASTGSTLWGLIDYTVATTDCASRDENSTYHGAWAGLIAHDGSQTYQLTSSTGTFTVSNAGKLAVGFDVPSTYSVACGMIQISGLSVTHCEDAAGTSVACPL